MTSFDVCFVSIDGGYINWIPSYRCQILLEEVSIETIVPWSLKSSVAGFARVR